MIIVQEKKSEINEGVALDQIQKKVFASLSSADVLGIFGRLLKN